MKRALVLCLVTLIGCTSNKPGVPADAGGGDDGGGGEDGGIDTMPPRTGRVGTLAGTFEAGLVDGTGSAARFSNPANVAVGPDGKVYVADYDNFRIRVVDPADGATTTLFTMATFQRPFGMAFAGDGTLYVSTDRNPQGAQSPMSGTIWTIDIVAKTATPLVENIGRPRGLAVLPDGKIVATDYQHHVVELVDPVTKAVQVLAGTFDLAGRADGVGGEARFANPYDVVVVGGEIVVADRTNHQLRKVALDGTVTTLAGTGVPGYADGALAAAAFNRPHGLAVTASGDIYITDLDNYRVRRISGGMVDTIAGNGMGGHADSDDRLAAQFFGLEGLAATADGGKLFVADGNRGEALPYNRIRVIEMQ